MKLDEENIEDQLTIRNASTYELERELLSHPKKEAHFHRWYAQSIKRVDTLTMKLEGTIAEILNELIAEEEDRIGKQLSSYALDSYRKLCEKARIPLDKRYKKIKRELMEAQETKAVLEGFVKAWASRGYRLGELVKLAETMHFPEPRVYESKKEKFESAEDKLGEAAENIDVGP